MGNSFENFLSKIGSAEVTTRGEFVRDGAYLFEVAEIRYFEGNAGPTHVAELIVREAEARTPGVTPNAVGSKVSFVNVLVGKTKDVASGKIKGFALALFGRDVKLTSADEAAAIVSRITGSDTDRERGKVARGMLVRGSTFPWKSRSGVEGVGVNFEHVPGQTKEAVQARAAAQNAGK